MVSELQKESDEEGRGAETVGVVMDGLMDR